VVPSLAAICLLRKPATTSASTSRSRGVNKSYRALCSAISAWCFRFEQDLSGYHGSAFCRCAAGELGSGCFLVLDEVTLSGGIVRRIHLNSANRFWTIAISECALRRKSAAR
jgi:hypothetical protein